jgi:hypothetical protein
MGKWERVVKNLKWRMVQTAFARGLFGPPIPYEQDARKNRNWWP